MPTFRIAHIHEQGQDMIIIPLEDRFEFLTDEQRAAETVALQRCATAAGLKGTVVPVWHAPGGGFRFLAPTPWHPFFKSIDESMIAANLNKELTCG